MRDGGKVILGLGVVALATTLAVVVTRKPAAAPEIPPEVPPEEEGIIDAELRSSYVSWAALAAWQRVHTRWPNPWPADTDITLAWEIRSIGDVGAYFQVYMFNPGSWLYLDPGESTQVFEAFHTPAVPVTPGYQYYRIYILGRKLDGERIGAVWASEEVEVTYV